MRSGSSPDFPGPVNRPDVPILPLKIPRSSPHPPSGPQTEILLPTAMEHETPDAPVHFPAIHHAMARLSSYTPSWRQQTIHGSKGTTQHQALEDLLSGATHISKHHRPPLVKPPFPSIRRQEQHGTTSTLRDKRFTTFRPPIHHITSFLMKTPTPPSRVQE